MEGDPEGLGSYCEEWGINGRGTLRGWVRVVRSGVLRGGGTLRGWVLIVRSGVLRGGGTLRGWVLIAGNMVIMIVVVLANPC